MLNLNSLAHPYSSALFEIAKNSAKIDIWQEHLSRLSVIGQSRDFLNELANPYLSSERVFAILLSVLDNPDQEVTNFLHLLHNNKRLNLLADIYVVFDKLVEDYKSIAKAIIQSPFPLSDKDLQDFESLLGKKLGLTISAKVEIKPELIGGVKLLVNDVVIDASVKGSLEKMAAHII